MENSTHIFREGPYVSTHVRIGNQKKFCHELELVKEKREFFVPLILFKGNFFNIRRFISMYSVLNRLSEYKYFTYLTHYL